MAGRVHLNGILLEAVKRNDLLHVRLILAQGADPNATSSCGWTALHFAADRPKRTAVLFALLHGGARVNSICAYSGQTPLHIAAAAGNMPAVKLLLNCGADMFVRDFNEKTAREVARGSSALRRLLLGPTACDYLAKLEMTLLGVAPNAMRRHLPNPLQAGRTHTVRRTDPPHQHQQQQQETAFASAFSSSSSSAPSASSASQQRRRQRPQGRQRSSSASSSASTSTATSSSRAGRVMRRSTRSQRRQSQRSQQGQQQQEQQQQGRGRDAEDERQLLQDPGSPAISRTRTSAPSTARRRIRLFTRGRRSGQNRGARPSRDAGRAAASGTGQGQQQEGSQEGAQPEQQQQEQGQDQEQEQRDQQRECVGATHTPIAEACGDESRSGDRRAPSRRLRVTRLSPCPSSCLPSPGCLAKRGGSHECSPPGDTAAGHSDDGRRRGGNGCGRSQACKMRLTKSQVSQLTHALECGICLELMEEPVTLPCGHSFCLQCCEQLVASTRSQYFSCPLDRSKFPRQMPLGVAVTLRNVVSSLHRYRSSCSSSPSVSSHAIAT